MKFILATTTIVLCSWGTVAFAETGEQLRDDRDGAIAVVSEQSTKLDTAFVFEAAAPKVEFKQELDLRLKEQIKGDLVKDGKAPLGEPISAN